MEPKPWRKVWNFETYRTFQNYSLLKWLCGKFLQVRKFHTMSTIPKFLWNFDRHDHTHVPLFLLIPSLALVLFPNSRLPIFMIPNIPDVPHERWIGDMHPFGFDMFSLNMMTSSYNHFPAIIWFCSSLWLSNNTPLCICTFSLFTYLFPWIYIVGSYGISVIIW